MWSHLSKTIQCGHFVHFLMTRIRLHKIKKPDNSSFSQIINIDTFVSLDIQVSCLFDPVA